MGKSIFRWVLGGTVRKAGMGQEFVLPVSLCFGGMFMMGVGWQIIRQTEGMRSSKMYVLINALARI